MKYQGKNKELCRVGGYELNNILEVAEGYLRGMEIKMYDFKRMFE